MTSTFSHEAVPTAPAPSAAQAALDRSTRSDPVSTSLLDVPSETLLEMLRRRRRVAVQSVHTLLALVALALSAPGIARAEVHVTDVLGRAVTLAKPAERVMLGFYFEDFLAIAGPGAADRLRAVSLFYWQGYRPLQYAADVEALPKIADAVDVGDDGTLSAERIVAAGPDVAILPAAQHQHPGAAAATVEAAGIPIVVVDYNAQTVEKHVAGTLAIGEAMGTLDRAEALGLGCRAPDRELRRAGLGGGEGLTTWARDLASRQPPDSLRVDALPCLGGCARRDRLSLAAPGRWSRLFAGPDPERDAEASARFVEAWLSAPDGLVPQGGASALPAGSHARPRAVSGSAARRLIPQSSVLAGHARGTSRALSQPRTIS